MVSPFKEGTCHLPIYLICVPIVLLATKCLACQSATTGIDIHLCQTIPITTKTQNFHGEPIHLKWYIQAMLPSKNSIIMERGSSSLKQTGAEAMKKNRETRPIPPLKRVEIRGSNKKTKIFLSVSPFPPSPLNILPSIRSGFDQVPTFCEPLFGSATQITKVCYTLPT